MAYYLAVANRKGGVGRSTISVMLADAFAARLTNATAAALRLAAKVLVPVRPDAVSEFAADRIWSVIEAKVDGKVLEIPHQQRRYVCLANAVRPGGRDGTIIDTIAYHHPLLATRIRQPGHRQRFRLQ